MKIASHLILVAIVIASLTGCKNFRFPGVHKINIQQGHIITQEMVDELKTGMSKSQVRFVLGNSLLPNTFNDDRWDYYYSLRRGSDGSVTKHLFTVYFVNDSLERWEGDYMPTPVAISKKNAADKNKEDDAAVEDNPPVPSNSDELPVKPASDD